MPIETWGLGDLYDRIRQRVREELGPASQMAPVAPGMTEEPSLRARIRQQAREALGMTPEPVQEKFQGPPRSLDEVKERIQAAGRHRPPLLVRIDYNGHDRDAEVYSYRWRDKDRPWQPLLYIWCHKDNQIECLKLDKIHNIQLTERPYQPRYPVEF